jgi:hypothetical protein
MNLNEPDFFLGLCFLFSSLSKDKRPQACLVVKKKRIISSGFSSVDLLGPLEGSGEFLATSSISDSLSNYEIYLDHTPSVVVLNHLSHFLPRRIVYFETNPLCAEEVSFTKFEFIKFQGNINWIRDKVALMKSFDIFN